MKRMVEAGHHFQSIGTTQWTKTGWDLMEKIRQPKDSILLYTDDIRTADQVPAQEAGSELVPFDMNPDLTIMESEVAKVSNVDIWAMLMELAKVGAQGARDGHWRYEEIWLTNHEMKPTSVFSDFILQWHKYHDLHVREAVNILPYFYVREQRNLKRLLDAAMGNYKLEVILFDLHGLSWKM